MPSSMDFSEFGSFSGQKPARAPAKSTTFTQTCSLLSQYLKEKGTFGDLSLGMTRASDTNGMPETSPQTAATTMNLFPVANKLDDVPGASTRNTPLMNSRNLSSMDLFPQNSGLVNDEVPKKVDSSGNKSEPGAAQMTIFYGGQVIVFNDFPAEKAKEIMLLLSKYGSTPVQKPTEPTNLVPTNPSTVSNIGTNMVQEPVQQPPQPILADLPKIARRASLNRFLEKRKDRITARAPYVTSDSTAFPTKPAETKTWLGLAAQSPVQFEGQMY